MQISYLNSLHHCRIILESRDKNTIYLRNNNNLTRKSYLFNKHALVVESRISFKKKKKKKNHGSHKSWLSACDGAAAGGGMQRRKRHAESDLVVTETWQPRGYQRSRMTEESRGSALTRGKVIDVLSREKWRERGEDKYMPVLSRGTERIGGTVNPREENHVVSFNQRITSGSYGVTDSRIVRRRREELTDSRDRETDTENYKNRWLAGNRVPRASTGSLYGLPPCRWIVDGKNQQTSFPWWLPPPSTHAKPDDRDSLSPVYIRQLSVQQGGSDLKR